MTGGRGAPGRLRLAAVYAHPDDDTYSIGGSVALAGGSIELTLIVATSGEAGMISDPALATRDTLAQVREREERDALAELGSTDARVHFLRHPDGGLTRMPKERLVHDVAGLLVEARPHAVVTFGPEGVTGHDDHVAIHHVATEAFHAARAGLAGCGRRSDGVLARLLYGALPSSRVERFMAALRARGIEMDPDGPDAPRGVPDESIAVAVDCSAVAERKLSAIGAHRTQRGELDAIPRDLRRAMLGTEWFVQAWPALDRGPGTMSSLFEGLEATP